MEKSFQHLKVGGCHFPAKTCLEFDISAVSSAGKMRLMTRLCPAPMNGALPLTRRLFFASLFFSVTPMP
jgi:hypothetical protein